MDRLFLSIGASCYAGAVALALTSVLVYISANTMIMPLLILTGLGIAMITSGLAAGGTVGFYSAGALMVSGFILGVLGLFAYGWASLDYAHTIDVCAYSKLMPNDAYAQWACPQVAASNYVMQTLTVGLVIPSLLFLVVPYLAIRHRLLKRETKEVP